MTEGNVIQQPKKPEFDVMRDVVPAILGIVFVLWALLLFANNCCKG